MKKLMILPLIAILALGSSSCKKSGTCVCTIDGDVTNTAPNISKSDCNALDDLAKIGGGSCKLK